MASKARSSTKVNSTHQSISKKFLVGQNAFRSFQTLFQSLPVAYLINKRVLVMHGGLPMVDDIMIEDIRKLDRFLEPGEGSTLTDLLWADPQDAPGRGTSKRGTSAQFGPDITAEFCKQNGLDYIIRSHEVKEKGWESAHGGKCWTIFSGANTVFHRSCYLSISSAKLLRSTRQWWSLSDDPSWQQPRANSKWVPSCRASSMSTNDVRKSDDANGWPCLILILFKKTSNSTKRRPIHSP